MNSSGLTLTTLAASKLEVVLAGTQPPSRSWSAVNSPEQVQTATAHAGRASGGDRARVLNGDDRARLRAAGGVDGLDLPRRTVIPGMEKVVAPVNHVGAAVRVQRHPPHALIGQVDARCDDFALPNGQRHRQDSAG